MAYNVNNLARLSQLKALSQKLKIERDALSNRIDDIVTAGGEPNVITSIKVNGTAQTITDKAVNITVPTNVSQLSNDSGFQTEEQVNAKISATYKPGGSKAFASLPTPAVSLLGMVYNVTDAFTTTATFIEGAGKAYPAGTNVVVIQDGSAYKFDVLSGFVDLSGKVDKVDGKGLSTNDYTDAEKTKLEGLNNYTHPTHASKTSGLYKVTIDSLGHVSATATVAKADITGLGIPAQDTTYSPATASADGLMSSADKTKLDGITVATDEEVAEMLQEVFGA